VRGTLSLGLVAVSSYLAIVGQEVPEWLLGLTGLAVGQYLPRPGEIGGGR
jgi:hypothetical protein